MRNYQVFPLTLLTALTMATSSHAPAQPHDGSTDPDTDHIRESVRLLHQTVDSDSYPAEELEEYRLASASTMERLRALPSEEYCDDTQPLPEAGAVRLQRALERIANVASYTGTWNWPRVKAVALRFGTEIPSVYRNDQVSPIQSAWDNGRWRLVIYPGLIDEETTDASFISTIIHEATHVVVTEMMMEYTGFTAHEIYLLRENCEEFSRELIATTETLAYVNSGMWKRLNNTPVYPFELWASEAFNTIPATSWEDIGHATDAMMTYIYEGRETHLGVGTLPNCGHIVAERGPHRGEIVRPGMIAPDYMGPIFLHLVESR